MCNLDFDMVYKNSKDVFVRYGTMDWVVVRRNRPIKR